MLKTIVLYIALFSCCGLLNAQPQHWEYQNPLPTPENLYAVSFPDANTAFAVGNVGTIIKTTDAGDNWVIQQSGITTHLYGVSFSSADNGTAVGDDGIILRTTNGGNNWVQQSSGITNTLRGILFVDDLNGTAVGDDGIILRTTDGGNTWVAQTSGTTNHLNAVAFYDIQSWFAVGEGGKILKTIDGGTNWDPLTSGTNNTLNGVCFISRTNIMAVGDGIIVKTTDEGNTWNSTATSYNQTGISFSDVNNGIMTTEMNAVMYRTTDGGNNWYELSNNPADRYLYGVSFANANNGIAIGYYGTIIKTTDGGANWTLEQKGFPYDYLGNVDFPDVNHGWAVGSNNNLQRTTDKGETWIKQTLGSDGEAYTGISFSDVNNGYICGNNEIYKTINGGEDWVFIGGAPSLTAISSPAPNYMTTVSIYGDIFTTKDGGNSWYSHTDITPNGEFLNCVSFPDSLNGWVAGYQGIVMRTTDGGVTWIAQETGVNTWFYDICFVDANHGWVVGTYGTILRTTNGGTTWESLTTGINGQNHTLGGVSFIDVNNGMAVGGGTVYSPGVILRTTDGGDNWFVFEQPAESNGYLYDVSFVDENHAWIVGNLSIILRTTNGGGIVPVELTTFNASVNDDNVLLNWSTATETNNQGFEVERKVSSNEYGVVSWDKIGFVTGFGTTTETKSYSFSDNKVTAGKYLYRLKQIDFDGAFEYSNEIEAEIVSPKEFSLSQNYPNPFNPSTKLSFVIGHSSLVKLKVYNVLGEEVMTLVNKNLDAGTHNVEFNASNFNSGVYFYTLEAKGTDGTNFTSTKKMALIK